MKIAVFQNFYFPYNKGGAENFVKESISKLQNQNHQIILITTKPKDQKKFREEVDMIKTYRIPSKCHSLSEKSVLWRFFWHISNIYNPKREKIVKTILKNEKIDLCISHNLIGLGLFLPKLFFKLKIKHIHYLHDIQLLHPSGLMFWGKEGILNTCIAKKYQCINKYYFKHLYKVISPSSWLMKEHLNKGFFKQSAAEIKALKEINENTEKENRHKNSFLFVGQVEKHKGIEFLLNTFTKIENKNIELKVIGDGKDFNRLQELFKDDKRIIFLGRKNKEEVESQMKKSSVLIVPSLCYENSPTVIYEAKENNLTTIASSIGGVSEIIENPKLLFIPENEEDLLEKINMFIS